MKTSQEYETALRSCTRCATILSARPVDPTTSDQRVVPKPIVRPLRERPVMLIGQAPGLTEYQSGNPFSGSAGKDIRLLFAECGCNDRAFDELVHTSAVAKCFPGSKLTPRRRGEGSRREDVKPTRAMQSNCRPFLLAQLDLVKPSLVVLLGGLALETYVELREGKQRKVSLGEYVGRVESWSGRSVVALAHTSGGSFWLNDLANRTRQARAKELLAIELAKWLR
jgi:uracil-DNA glycosylase